MTLHNRVCSRKFKASVSSNISKNNERICDDGDADGDGATAAYRCTDGHEDDVHGAAATNAITATAARADGVSTSNNTLSADRSKPETETKKLSSSKIARTHQPTNNSNHIENNSVLNQTSSDPSSDEQLIQTIKSDIMSKYSGNSKMCQRVLRVFQNGLKFHWFLKRIW